MLLDATLKWTIGDVCSRVVFRVFKLYVVDGPLKLSADAIRLVQKLSVSNKAWVLLVSFTITSTI